MTLSDQLERSGGRPSGFDYIRVVLAVSVVVWHTVIVCYGREAESWFWTGPLRPLIFAGIPCFLAFSGFLIAGSLERNSLNAFFALRIIRIFPPLLVEVVLCALLLGPMVTTLPLGEYFTSRQFFGYFGNLFGWVHFSLPGVFMDLPAGGYVNIQLWTIPYELLSYIAIVALALVGLVARPRWLLFAGIAAALAITAYKVALHPDASIDGRTPGRFVLTCFIAGATIYLLRATIPFNWALFGIAVGLSWALLSYGETVYLAALPIAYLTVFLGLLNPPRTAVVRGADYSYGVYLYGFPFQQLLAHLFPDYRVWWFNLIGSLLLTGLFAALSWYVVERPLLLRKHVIVELVNRLTPASLQVWLSRHRSEGTPTVGRTFRSSAQPG